LNTAWTAASICRPWMGCPNPCTPAMVMKMVYMSRKTWDGVSFESHRTSISDYYQLTQARLKIWSSNPMAFIMHNLVYSRRGTKMNEIKVIAHITATARIPLPANIFSRISETLLIGTRPQIIRRCSREPDIVLKNEHIQNPADCFLAI
jgi:hypothetical protein